MKSKRLREVRLLRLRAEHYLHYIKDQTDVALTVHILRLQKENSLFVRKLEHEQVGKIRPLTDKDLQTIRRYRWYLEDTQVALKNLGIQYAFNESEKWTLEFQYKIPMISRLGFYIGGYLGGIEKYDVLIDDEQAHITYSLSNTNAIPPIIHMDPDHLSKEEFLDFIYSLNMGEWNKEYLTNGRDYMLFENTLWGVEVYYEDGSDMVSFGGLNAFPYNFQLFLNFFEMHKKKVDKI